MSGLYELDLSCRWNAGQLREGALLALAASPHLTNLQALDMGGWPTSGSDEVRALVESPLLPGLRLLRMPHVDLAGARLLLGSAASAGLQRLSFADSRVGSELGAAIAAATHLTYLAELNLDYTALGDSGLAALAGSPHLSRLTTLSLVGDNITRTGIGSLLQSPHLPRLRLIYVGHGQSVELGSELQERFIVAENH